MSLRFRTHGIVCLSAVTELSFQHCRDFRSPPPPFHHFTSHTWQFLIRPFRCRLWWSYQSPLPIPISSASDWSSPSHRGHLILWTSSICALLPARVRELKCIFFHPYKNLYSTFNPVIRLQSPQPTFVCMSQLYCCVVVFCFN